MDLAAPRVTAHSGNCTLSDLLIGRAPALGTGAITTLGRGGSDLTATLIGAALHVPEVQVWKDVDGALLIVVKVYTLVDSRMQAM